MFRVQLRNELLKLFGKKRTYIGFGAFLLAQNAMLLTFHFSHWHVRMEKILELNGYPVYDFISALTVSIIMVFPQILLLIPLYTCLIGGDLVAKEYEDGTLRMILSRPISRFRLILVKWCAGVIFSIILVISLGIMALFFARLWFSWGGLFVFIPEPEHIFSVFDSATGLKLYMVAHIFLSIDAATMMTIAFMFGCFNVKPAAATILGLSFLLLNLIVENLPFMQDYRQYFLIHYLRMWTCVFGQPVDWMRIIESLIVIFAFNFTTLIIGMIGFHIRDIKS